jgi:hypothetical protein
MAWFVASIVHAIVPLSEDGVRIPVFENAYLIQAKGYDEACAEAERIGASYEGLDDAPTVAGSPAINRFLGVRKVLSVSNPPPFDQDEDRPLAGTELTYSYFEADSIEQAEALARGEAVKIIYVDDAEYDEELFPR